MQKCGNSEAPPAPPTIASLINATATPIYPVARHWWATVRICITLIPWSLGHALSVRPTSAGEATEQH